MTESTAAVRVVVAVLTFRRPHDLMEILPALVTQAASVGDRVEVLVIDNDPDAGAREYTEGVRTVMAPVRYVHEAAPGIAAARNRALREASGADLLVFIDDDERPVDDWLARLLAAWRQHRSAAVVGAVVSRFDSEPDSWITAGRFFERRRLPTGTVVDVAATNNLLLDLETVRRLKLGFDTRYGLSGGSDYLFTRQLHELGGVLVWCDEAIVFDVVPPNRSTRYWVLRRAFRSGNTASLVALDPTLARRRVLTRMGMLARGSVRVAGGTMRFATGVVTGHVGRRARGLRTVARGAGMLAGSFGSVYYEYRRS